MLNQREMIVARLEDGTLLIEVGDEIIDGEETTMVVIDSGNGQRSRPVPRATALAMNPYWLAPDSAGSA